MEREYFHVRVSVYDLWKRISKLESEGAQITAIGSAARDNENSDYYVNVTFFKWAE